MIQPKNCAGPGVVRLPLTLGADLGSRVATAAINLGLGVIITVLVSSTAASASWLRARHQPDES